MPFVKFSNKTQTRTIKQSFIWLDYAVFIKGDPTNFVLTIRDSMSEETETFRFLNSGVDRLNQVLVEFQNGPKSPIIRFGQTEKYFLEIDNLRGYNQQYEINLYFK